MCDLYVRDILKICNAMLLSGSENQILGPVVTDTRILKKGDVYIGLKGEKVNGSDYYKEAIEKGASICILNKKVEVIDNCTIIVVDDTLKCLQELAKYKRSLLNIPVVAITGSVGKTSTKDMIASVISTKYSVHKTEGNYNNHIGVPLTILSYTNEDIIVVEMGMNHLREIALLTDIAKPTIAVITNVGTAHIGNLGSRENILKAKLEILESMSVNDVVINVDNDMLKTVEEQLREDYLVKTISIEENSDYKAINIKEDIFNSKFDIENISKGIHVNVGGKVFIYNSLVAYAIGDILRIKDKDIKKGIKNFKLTNGRLEKKKALSGATIIDDTYNANFDSMKASIELLGKIKGRKIAILGSMLELGDYSKELHKTIGEVVVNNNIDYLITVGTEAKEIDKNAIKLGMNKENVSHFKTYDETYPLLDELITKKDTILLKGSHGIELYNIVDYLTKKK